METGKKKKAYLNFMAVEDSKEIIALLEKEKLPSALGSEDFIDWVKATFFDKKQHREVPDVYITTNTEMKHPVSPTGIPLEFNIRIRMRESFFYQNLGNGKVVKTCLAKIG